MTVKMIKEMKKEEDIKKTLNLYSYKNLLK